MLRVVISDDTVAQGEADQLLRRVVVDHTASQVDLGAAILDRLRETLPEFFADEDVAYDMAAAVDGNVARLHHLLAHSPSGVASEALPIEAADLLQSTIQHGIPLISLLDAYRSAQAIAADWWQDKLDHTAAPQVVALATKKLNQLIVSYTDAAASEIRASYGIERQSHDNSIEGRRAHIIRKLLAGEPLDHGAAARILDHPLFGHHIGVVAWRTDDHDPDDLLDRAIAGLAGSLDDVRTLKYSARHRVYAWLSTTGRLNSGPLHHVRVPPGVRAAASGVHNGVDGFVQAHLDAVQTAGIVREHASPTADAIAVYEDVELVALLSRDPDARDRLVRRVLGPLAENSRDARRARETLQAYMDSGSSPSRAAQRLGVHRNTVTNRLASIGILIGVDFASAVDTPTRLEIELALRVISQLGPPDT